MSDEPLRVDIDDMDFNPATYEYLYQGKPFTGEMYEYGVDGTVRGVKAISEFYDGIQHGISRVFYANGELYSESRYEYGREMETTYYHDGTPSYTVRRDDEGRLV
jgi:antitoxin component YwqK of YwqJK toxin-antitoxin module